MVGKPRGGCARTPGSLGLLAGLLLSAGTAVNAAPGTWSVVETPNSAPTATDNHSAAVGCLSANDCWAVGYYNRGGTFQTLVQHWDGTAWTVVASPNSGTTQANLLRGVSCVSPSDCWAVGSHDSEDGTRTLIQRWDGSAWAIVASPNLGAFANSLSGVACAAANDCWAVGTYYSGGANQTLVLRWNGSAWSVAASPNTGATRQNFLNGVTCVSATDCWAVGSTSATPAEQTLVLHWNGSAWSIVTSPNASLAQYNILYGVSCATALDCWAVGAYNNGSVQQALLLRWNGTAWAVALGPMSMAGQNHGLLGASCVSPAQCWAVGSREDAGVQQTLVERWDGTSWAVVPSRNASTAANDLRGIHCLSAADCRAVGSFNESGVQQSLVEHWDGAAWRLVPGANARADRHNTLLGVHCVSAADCWAVASHERGGVMQTMIQHWDGDAWSITPSPNTDAALGNILYDVSCSSTADCWAAGYSHNGAIFQTLFLRWDGGQWSIVPSPNPPLSQNSFINRITCVSTSECWAAGYYNAGAAYQTLILRWDGSGWDIVASPNHDETREHRLFGIDCASPSDCWAVGRYFTGTEFLTLVEHWDGAAWSIVASPNQPEAPDNAFTAVNCTSTSACWAVGNYGYGSGTAQPLVARWDGAAWSQLAVPSPVEGPLSFIFLRDIDCASPSNCWTVGYGFEGGRHRTLIEHWDGAGWSIVASANSNDVQNNHLFGVSCASLPDCWAVGYHYDDSGVLRTLAQQYVWDNPPVTPFAFAPRAGVATGVFVTSESRTMAGYSGSLPVSVRNGQYSINGGPFTMADGVIAAGSTLRLRHLSAGSAGQEVITGVTVGSYSGASLTSTTGNVDRTPDGFGFDTQSGVAAGQPVASNVITLLGYSVDLPLQPGPGVSYRVNGSEWRSGAGTLPVGATLQLRHTAATAPSGYTKTYIKAGGVVGYFTTRTVQ